MRSRSVAGRSFTAHKTKSLSLSWVAVKELKLNYCIEETLLFTVYTHYGNLILVRVYIGVILLGIMEN